jgi:Fe-S cluster biogenesis protein NfuA/nitrite reductase/ring-hydroxylating ferredoxin subunit
MTVPNTVDKDFQARVRKIETLIQGIDSIGDRTTQAYTQELVQALLDLHGTGLERMLDTIYATGAPGEKIIDDLGQDELVGALLLLHGLHPFSLEERVLNALEKVRPYMQTHGGNVELLGVTEQGGVKLRLTGSCNGCPSSRVTLNYAVEEAIYAAAPDVMAIETEGAVEPQRMPVPSGLIPMLDLIERGVATNSKDKTNGNGNGNGWVDVESSIASLHEGTLRVMQVSGVSVLFCRVAENYYAYASTCPNCHQLLGLAKLRGKDLLCSTCGHEFDVMRAGRDLGDHTLHLEPYPLLQEQMGQVRIALHH